MALPRRWRGSADSGTAATRRVAVNADHLATSVIHALAATGGFRDDLVIDDQKFSHDLLRSGGAAGAITAQPGAAARPRQPAPRHPALHRHRQPQARWFQDTVTPQSPRAPALRFNDKDRLQPQRAAPQGWPDPLPSPPRVLHRLGRACRASPGWAMNP